MIAREFRWSAGNARVPGPSSGDGIPIDLVNRSRKRIMLLGPADSIASALAVGHDMRTGSCRERPLMEQEQPRIERIMLRMPADMRVVVDTIRACATSEFRRRWPATADDMAAVVCGRWLHTSNISMATSDISCIDRLVNESFATLDDEQIAATERMFDQLSRAWREQ